MVNETTNAPLPPVSFDEFAPTSYAEWKEEAVASLKGAPFEKKLLSKTYEGLTLEPIYTAADAEAFAQRLSFPGAEDFLRGVRAGGYLAQPWAVAQDLEEKNPAKANAQLKQELAKGGSAISFDLAELGLQDLDDLLALLDEVCLLKAPLNVYAGASALPFLGLLKARIAAKGISEYNYSGCVGADPVGEYALTGQAQQGLACAVKQMAAALRWTNANMPELKTILVRGTVYHNAGAHAVQEVAMAMATAIYYLDALGEQGFSVDQIAKSIRFKFSLGANFFMEIAKLRAARLIWAQIIKAYGGSEEAGRIDVAAETSSFNQTVFDPYVNVLRATTQAFSGAVGGVSAMTVRPFDAAIRKSDEHSRRIARNIQVMMAEEFNLVSPVDPAGGSWYIETLTGQLADAIWAQLQQIDAAGGAVAVLQSGVCQDEIGAVLAERLKKLALRSDKAVGSNMYRNMTEQPLDQHCCCGCGAPAVKSGAAVDSLDHCVEAIATAFAQGAVVADVTKALNCGSEPEIKALTPHRWTEQFEALCAATDKYIAEKGENIKIFLCNMGPIPQHKARADFAAGFMEVARFEVLRNNGFATVEEAVAAAAASGAAVAVICSTDDTYPELVPPLARGIKAAAPDMKVMLAGAPAAEMKDAYDQAGVDEYIHVRANCLQILSQIQKERGIC